jgi:putative transposase
MRKSRFTDEQITGILSEAKAGLSTLELCRKHGITSKTLYNWRSKFGGMQATEVRKLKNFEEKISRLERIVAQQALELMAAKEVIRGKW